MATNFADYRPIPNWAEEEEDEPMQPQPVHLQTEPPQPVEFQPVQGVEATEELEVADIPVMATRPVHRVRRRRRTQGGTIHFEPGVMEPMNTELRERVFRDDYGMGKIRIHKIEKPKRKLKKGEKSLMSDQVLIKNAGQPSDLIDAIDESWRERLEAQDLENTFLPFKGNYECSIRDGVVITGWEGTMVINKFYYRGNTYRLTEPWTKPNFKIRGVYSFQKEFQIVISEPVFGFHYRGHTRNGRKICLGHIKNTHPSTLEELQKMCANVAKNLELVNMDSMGSICMDTEENADIVRALGNGRDNLHLQLPQLLIDGRVKKLL